MPLFSLYNMAGILSRYEALLRLWASRQFRVLLKPHRGHVHQPEFHLLASLLKSVIRASPSLFFLTSTGGGFLAMWIRSFLLFCGTSSVAKNIFVPGTTFCSQYRFEKYLSGDMSVASLNYYMPCRLRTLSNERIAHQPPVMYTRPP